MFLVATIDQGGEATGRDALPDLSGMVRAVAFRETRPSSSRWSLRSDRRPSTGRFQARSWPNYIRSSSCRGWTTPGDLLFHLRSESLDVWFEPAGRIVTSRPAARRGRPAVRQPRSSRLWRQHGNPGGLGPAEATQIGDEGPENERAIMRTKTRIRRIRGSDADIVYLIPAGKRQRDSVPYR